MLLPSNIREQFAAAISKITVNSGKRLQLEYTQSTEKVQFRGIGNIRRVNAFALGCEGPLETGRTMLLLTDQSAAPAA